MSIMELGALGEFVGAIAVFATPGFLAVQVSPECEVHGVERHRTGGIGPHGQCAVHRSPALAEAIDKSRRGEPLDSIQWLRLTVWFTCFLRGAETHVQMAKLGVVPEFEAPWKDILRDSAT